MEEGKLKQGTSLPIDTAIAPIADTVTITEHMTVAPERFLLVFPQVQITPETTGKQAAEVVLQVVKATKNNHTTLEWLRDCPFLLEAAINSKQQSIPQQGIIFKRQIAA